MVRLLGVCMCMCKLLGIPMVHSVVCTPDGDKVHSIPTGH